MTCNGRLAEPEFDPRIDSFKVVLGRGGVEIAENRRWLTRTVAHDLDAHERAIAVMIRREGSATVADVRARLGIDSDEIRGAFQSLVDEGVLRRIGRDEVGLARTSRWSREEWRRNIVGALSPSEPVYARRHSSPMAAIPRWNFGVFAPERAGVCWLSRFAGEGADVTLPLRTFPRELAPRRRSLKIQ